MSHHRKQRAKAWPLTALALLASPAAAEPAYHRIMSINACTDQLVLALLPPSRITSVTWLSRNPSGSLLWRQARQVPANHGTAEEVLRDHPDLVVAEPYATPATRALLHRLGVPMLEVREATSVDDIRAITRTLAAILGVAPTAEALIAHMNRVLAAPAASTPPIRVAAWDGAGFSPQPGTLYTALLASAGATIPPAGTARPDAETLLAAAPALLIEGGAGAEAPSLRGNLLHHPLVQRFWADRIVHLPAAYYACGTPASADGVALLRAAFAARQAVLQSPLAYAK